LPGLKNGAKNGMPWMWSQWVWVMSTWPRTGSADFASSCPRPNAPVPMSSTTSVPFAERTPTQEVLPP
jgi:hypothetical protein